MKPGYPRYALIVIFTANFLSYLDRQLVSALEEPICSSLHLGVVEYNLLWTLFTVGYMLCSPFIGYASDHSRRPRLFAVCIFVWSLATIASGMATIKPVLYVSRVLIGLGEAGCLIIGSAMISDFFGPEMRGRALSIFYLGMPIGGTFAFIMAGLLLDLGWRNLFYIAGFPGFILTVLIWKMIDPPRGSLEKAPAPAGESQPSRSLHSGAGLSEPSPLPDQAKVKGAPLRDYLQLLKTPTLLLVILAQAFAVIILVPLVHDGVEFFVKFRGLGPKEARLALGLIALIAGGLGNGLSGTLGDKLRRRFKGAYALLAGISFLAGFPCLVVGFKASNPWVFLPALTLGAFCIFLCMPAVNTQIANSTRPTQRAMAWAMAVFILHLLGDTSAPVIFSLVTRHVGRLNAFLIFSTALVPAAICCFLAARSAPRDEARIAESPNQA